jgi:signal transduction histidine kinase
LASADRRISDRLSLVRLAEDSRLVGHYRDVMSARLGPDRVDLLLAAALFFGVVLQAVIPPLTTSERLVTLVVGGLVTGSVAVRRRFPAAVGIGVQALLVVTGLAVRLPAGPITIGWFCALYALAVWTSTRWFIVGVTFFVVSDLAPEVVKGEIFQTAVAPFTAGAVVVMVLLRRVVGERDRRLLLAERERDLAKREAVIEERERIARELHDVIAHHVSMMVVQAGGERRVLEPANESTREVLTTIERIGRSALTEMRRLVGMLRGDDETALAPQPGISDLPTLVGQMRSAGLEVDLDVEGEHRDIPAGIGLSAYRIVQEGLTNAVKHAGGGRTRVRVCYGADSLEIEIVDDGGDRSVEVDRGGRGLVGMRERVALYGGTLDAGRRPAGGFAVRVLLPTR